MGMILRRDSIIFLILFVLFFGFICFGAYDDVKIEVNGFVEYYDNDALIQNCSYSIDAWDFLINGSSLSGSNAVKGYSYIIYLAGDVCYAVNGTTNLVEFSNTSDDHSVIQYSIDNLPDIGGRILLMPGSYRCDSPIDMYRDIADWFSIYIVGSGWKNTRIYLEDNADCNLFEMIPTGHDSGMKCIMEMELVGNKANNDDSHGIYMTENGGNMYDLIFENLLIDNFNDTGMFITDCWGVRLNGILSEFNGGDGVRLQGDQVYIDNMFSSYNEGCGLNITGDYFEVSNSRFRDNDMHGVYASVNYSTFTGGQVLLYGDDADYKYSGYYIDGAGNCIQGVKITGSWGDPGRSWRSFYIDGADNTVENCFSVDCNISFYGTDCNYLMLSNNNFGHGLIIDDANQPIINSNRICRQSSGFLNISYANVVIPIVTCNNWIGASQNIDYSNAVASRIHDNIDKDGNWAVEV